MPKRKKRFNNLILHNSQRLLLLNTHRPGPKSTRSQETREEENQFIPEVLSENRKSSQNGICLLCCTIFLAPKNKAETSCRILGERMSSAVNFLVTKVMGVTLPQLEMKFIAQRPLCDNVKLCSNCVILVEEMIQVMGEIEDLQDKANLIQTKVKKRVEDSFLPINSSIIDNQELVEAYQDIRKIYCPNKSLNLVKICSTNKEVYVSLRRLGDPDAAPARKRRKVLLDPLAIPEMIPQQFENNELPDAEEEQAVVVKWEEMEFELSGNEDEEGESRLQPNTEEQEQANIMLPNAQVVVSSKNSNDTQKPLEIYICNLCFNGFLSKEDLISHHTQFHSKTDKNEQASQKNIRDEKATESSTSSDTVAVCDGADSQGNKVRLITPGNGENLKFPICTICRIGFVSESQLSNHQELVHNANVPKFSCPRCYKNFDTMFKYNDHISKEHLINQMEKSIPVTKPLIYYCNDCPNNFNDIKAFSDHQKTHLLDSMQTIFHEKIQKEPQKNSESVKQTQVIERKFKCGLENCHELFYNKIVRNIHQSKAHQLDKLYNCEYEGCDRSFEEISTFEDHKRFHIGKKIKDLIL